MTTSGVPCPVDPLLKEGLRERFFLGGVLQEGAGTAGPDAAGQATWAFIDDFIASDWKSENGVPELTAVVVP